MEGLKNKIKKKRRVFTARYELGLKYEVFCFIRKEQISNISISVPGEYNITTTLGNTLKHSLHVRGEGK
jgi:hypothetical protein